VAARRSTSLLSRSNQSGRKGAFNRQSIYALATPILPPRNTGELAHGPQAHTGRIAVVVPTKDDIWAQDRGGYSVCLADRPVAVGVVPTQAQFAADALRRRWRPSLRLMRLRVSNPALIPDLLEFLRWRVDVVAEEVSDNEVDVSLVGSYNADAMNIELYLRVRAWEAGRRSTGVEVETVD
jgi:hypothetical protein